MPITLWVTHHHHLITSSCWFVILIVNPSNQLICPLETLSAPAPGSVWCYKRSRGGGDHTGTEPGLVCMISQSMTGSEPGRWPLCHCHRICSLSLCSTFCVLMMMVSAPPLAPGPGVSNDGVWRLSPCHTIISWPWPCTRHSPAHPDPDTHTSLRGDQERPDWSLHHVYTGLWSLVTPLKMLSCSQQLPARNSAPTMAFSGLTFKYQQPERNYRTSATAVSSKFRIADER